MGDCHYLYGNQTTNKRARFLKQLMAFSGIEEERLRVKWVSSAEGPEFAQEMNDFVKRLTELGPSPLNQTQTKKDAA